MKYLVFVVIFGFLSGCGASPESAQTAVQTSPLMPVWTQTTNPNPTASPTPTAPVFPPTNPGGTCWIMNSKIFQYRMNEHNTYVSCTATPADGLGSQTSFGFTLNFTGTTPNGGTWQTIASGGKCEVDINTGGIQPSFIFGYLGSGGTNWGEALINGSYAGYYLNCTYQ